MKWFALAWFLCSWGFPHPPPSPCPSVFQYRDFGGMWVGIVSIQGSRLDLPLDLVVKLTLQAILKTKYVGILELEESPETVLECILTSPVCLVNYTIRFPLPYPLPQAESITLNDRKICQGLPVSGGVVTTIYLEHTFPTNPPPQDVHTPPTHRPQQKGGCGVSTVTRPMEGKLTGNGEWPWLAAIFVKNIHGLKFHCSGSLISNVNIVTAAHCLQNHRDSISAEDLVVYFGKHNLFKWAELHSQIRDVDSITLHPDYSTSYYVADLAVITLTSPVLIDKYVRPVCLWKGEPSLTPLVGRLGTVVGWGKNKNEGTIRPEPRMFQLPIVDQEECLRSRKDFLYITSHRTLCAGWRNGTGPCNGDSGSGLMVLERGGEGTLVWQLRGIISLSLLDPVKQTCDLSNYLVFTDAAKFQDWLEQYI